MIAPPKGIKKQVFGGVLFCLGAMTALLAGTIGFDLDIFYVAISIIGVCLFLYGTIEKRSADGGVPYLVLKGKPMKNAGRSLALLLVIAVAATALIAWRSSGDTAVKPPEEIADYLFWQAKDLADFRLAGAGGKTLSPDDLKGKWSFIFFGYTHCPDVCPTTLGAMGKAFKLLEQTPAVSQEIQGIFISVDPGRDTPESLKEYVSHFGNQLMGVTGDAAQLEAFARQMSALYTVHAGDPKQSDTYLVSHNSTIFLVDPRGRLYGRFPPPQTPQELAGVFVKIRAFYNERAKRRWGFF